MDEMVKRVIFVRGTVKPVILNHSGQGHLRFQAKGRPYAFNICKKSVIGNRDLKIILHIHTKEKPFVKFATRFSLKIEI
ncbi:UNVERIFIED_CONTAM: hypothetical protein NCL1_48860 [Trichonephila clavipes]